MATDGAAESEAAKEIGILRSLCHPNIVRLMEVIGDDCCHLYCCESGHMTHLKCLFSRILRAKASTVVHPWTTCQIFPGDHFGAWFATLHHATAWPSEVEPHSVA